MRIKLTAVILLCFVSYSFAQKVPLTKEAGVIPPEFHLNNDTLLFETTNPFYRISMKKHFKRHYTGAFIFVTSPKKYSVETCRYVIIETADVKKKTVVGGPFDNTSRYSVVHTGFTILDRITGHKYINTNIASPKLLDAYAKALEEARLVGN